MQNNLVLIADEVYQVRACCVRVVFVCSAFVACATRASDARCLYLSGQVCTVTLRLSPDRPSPQQTTTCPPQANIYDPSRAFHSFKKVVRELEAPCPLVSLHSTSKGFVGECGRRGGYMEVVNFPQEIHEQVGSSLCSSRSAS